MKSEYADDCNKARSQNQTVRAMFWLAVCFVLSRILFYWAGVRFDAAILSWGWHFPDTILLKDDLFRSGFLYFPSSPPAYIFLLGGILKTGLDVEIAGAVCYLALGMVGTIALYLALTGTGVAPWRAFAAALLFAISPGNILYENWLFYCYPLCMLFCISAAALVSWGVYHRISAILTFALAVTALCLTRSAFHILYAFLCALLVWVLSADARKWYGVLVLTSMLTVISVPYVKNQILFGNFAPSTWAGMNLWRIVGGGFSKDERSRLVDERHLPEAARYAPFLPLDQYGPEIPTNVPTRFSRIPVLTERLKTSGAPNFNHYAYIHISREQGLASLKMAFLDPMRYLRTVAKSFLIYSAPSHHYAFLNPNRLRILRWERLWDAPQELLRVRFGRMHQQMWQPDPSEWTPYIAAESADVQIAENEGGVMREFSFFAFFLAAILAEAIIYLWSSRQNSRTDVIYLLTAFCVGTILWVMFTGNFFEYGENNRMRFSTNPLYLILFVLAIERWLAKRRLREQQMRGSSSKGGARTRRACEGTRTTPGLESVRGNVNARRNCT